MLWIVIQKKEQPFVDCSFFDYDPILKAWAVFNVGHFALFDGSLNRLFVVQLFVPIFTKKFVQILSCCVGVIPIFVKFNLTSRLVNRGNNTVVRLEVSLILGHNLELICNLITACVYKIFNFHISNEQLSYTLQGFKLLNNVLSFFLLTVQRYGLFLNWQND